MMHRTRTCFGGARMVQTSISMRILVGLGYRTPPGVKKFHFFVRHAFEWQTVWMPLCHQHVGIWKRS